MAETGGQVERVEDFGKGDDGKVRRWKTELELARKGQRKLWLDRQAKITRRYRLEKQNAESGAIEGGAEQGLNILWANVRTTAGQIYAKPPKIVVERRHMDGSLVARAACTILERTLAFQMKLKGGQFHETMKAARLDFQLGGKAEGRVRYEQDAEYATDIGAPTKPLPMPDSVTAYPGVAFERLCFESVRADDIIYPAVRGWDEILQDGWIAYRSYMTRKQIKEAKVFGGRAEYVAKNIPCKAKPVGMTDSESEKPENGALMRAQIWAIFSKTDKKIIYLCEDWNEIIAEVADPSSLEDFFPSPRPARDTVTNDTIYPVPAFTEYSAQANELDELTRRASLVLENIRVTGVYDQSHQELKALIDGKYENQMISVANWAQFAEKGGLEGATDWLPIKESADVLQILYQARMLAKQDTDQMSGVFDVMRGESNPNEKLGTQKLKTGFGDLRSSEPKEELARFARDMLAIGGEMVAEHFSDASLWQMSNFALWFKGQEKGLRARMASAQTAPQPGAGPPVAAPGTPGQAPGMPAPAAPPQPPMPGMQQPMGAPPATPPQPAPDQLPTAEEVFRQAVELLRNEKLRGFTISVETDSTIEPDAQVEQAKRAEFLQAAAAFLEKAAQIAMLKPKLLPLLVQMMLFGVRGFNVGRELETAFETVLQEIENEAAQAALQPPPPSPEQIKANAEREKMQMEAQAAQQERAAEAQAQQAQFAMDMQKMQSEMQADRERQAMEMQKMQAELQAMREKLAMEREKGQMDLQLKAQQSQLDAEAAERDAELEAETAERDHAMQREAMEDKQEHDRASSELKLETQRRAAAQKPKPEAKK